MSNALPIALTRLLERISTINLFRTILTCMSVLCPFEQLTHAGGLETGYHTKWCGMESYLLGTADLNCLLLETSRPCNNWWEWPRGFVSCPYIPQNKSAL